MLIQNLTKLKAEGLGSQKKIAGVLPTATGPAKHLFRQIEKKTWAIDDRVRRIVSYFYINIVVYSKVPIRHTFPIRNTVLNKCIGGDFYEFYSVKFFVDKIL